MMRRRVFRIRSALRAEGCVDSLQVRAVPWRWSSRDECAQNQQFFNKVRRDKHSCVVLHLLRERNLGVGVGGTGVPRAHHQSVGKGRSPRGDELVNKGSNNKHQGRYKLCYQSIQIQQQQVQHSH
jgi:hypothetical protein